MSNRTTNKAEEARTAFGKDIASQRERMADGLARLMRFIEMNGPEFEAIDDFGLYYWLKEMVAYFEKDLLPQEVVKQLEASGFSFSTKLSLSPQLAAQVKTPRYKKRYAYDNR